ncbi:MAG: cytochrome P450 [Myxococcales bacterium]|nr:cytochrome P450 [Myxococcales bacterium]
MLHLAPLASTKDLPLTPLTPAPKDAPRYPGLPIVGPLFEMRKDYISFLRRAAAMGDVVKADVGPHRAYLLNHPDAVGHVLVEHFRDYEKQTRGYTALRMVVGNGLVTSEGPFWQRQRRIANPAFKKHKINDFGPDMVGAAQRMVAKWQPAIAAGQPIDIANDMMRVTLDIVCRTLLSADVNDHASEIGKALHELLTQTMGRITKVVDLPLHWPTPANIRFRRARASLDRIVLGMIEERRQSGHDPHDLLSLLMSAVDEETGEKMNDAQLRDEAMTIFLAGHETTANALGWAMYLLSQHPTVEAKVRAELADVLGDQSVQTADFARLPYLQMVLKETMRLYPPVWILARRAVKDDVILGYKIDKGAYVFLPTYTLHRHPQFWQRPDSFEPERWATDGKGMHKYQYLPFSVGGRKCIGDHFAMLEATLVLATMLPQVQLSLVPGQNIELEPTITLRPRHGLWMQPTRAQPSVHAERPLQSAAPEQTAECAHPPEVVAPLTRTPKTSGCPFHAGRTPVAG